MEINMMNASSSLLIVVKKKNVPLGNLLAIEVRKAGYKAKVWTESEYEKADATSMAQRTVFVEDSKPLKNHRNSLDELLSVDGISLRIGANEAALDVEQKLIKTDNAEVLRSWYPSNSLSKISDFNENDGQVHKGMHKLGNSFSALTKKVKSKSKPVVNAVETAKVAASVVNGIGIMGAPALYALHVSKQDLIDDVDVAIVFLFVNYYLKDFMASDSDGDVEYMTQSDVREALDADHADEKAEDNE